MSRKEDILEAARKLFNEQCDDSIQKETLMPQAHNKASDWFDGLYKENKKSHENIPWAKQAVNPLLQSYLDENLEHKGRALVIGCGLSDDAMALSEAGYDVTAIDVSQTALDLAKARFSDTNIVFKKQDIFEYSETFDFVFEAFTVQSLPVEFRHKMIQAVARTVEKDGRLLLIAHKKEADFKGSPWPLTSEEVDLFKASGLRELSSEIYTEESKISSTRFRVLYTKDKRC
ncbi:MAG TPA: methyltransferase domain-containing protein [Sulfurovum sp.]|nr:methyltransferase domain-containing protein [Sulfurovum sp.]